jgi:nucleoside-diphosphate-sugar epimerase
LQKWFFTAVLPLFLFFSFSRSRQAHRVILCFAFADWVIGRFEGRAARQSPIDLLSDRPVRGGMPSSARKRSPGAKKKERHGTTSPSSGLASQVPDIQGSRVLILGGNGFVGQTLMRELLERGAHVLVYDCTPHPVRKSTSARHQRELYTCGDVTDADTLGAAVRNFGPSCVIHLASCGMSGAAMLECTSAHVNITGTRVALEAAISSDVCSFVYISSYNVVFHGQEIVGGDEGMPYSVAEAHSDVYSPSKAEAEKLVLAANGRQLASGGNLTTCVLRPAAIYGVGEQRHMPRIAKLVDLGLNFRIGRAVVDWVKVDNLVLAILLAQHKLAALRGKSTSAPAGRAYFISDNDPIDNFEFLRPIIESRGKRWEWVWYAESAVMGSHALVQCEQAALCAIARCCSLALGASARPPALGFRFPGFCACAWLCARRARNAACSPLLVVLLALQAVWRVGCLSRTLCVLCDASHIPRNLSHTPQPCLLCILCDASLAGTNVRGQRRSCWGGRR